MNIKMTTPGKLNLYLKVTQRRPDGYHELDTLFMPTPGVADIVTLTVAEELSVTSDNNTLPAGEANICYRAAQAYAVAAGIPDEWHIHLEKHIPIAAGMGGGSSNAAAVLRLLQQHYQALNDDEMKALALSLGADVPFFLEPVLARGNGVGEQLTAIPDEFPSLPLLIIYPRFPVSAAWAYQNLAPENISPSPATAIDDLLNAWRRSEWDKMGKLFHNDLGIALFDKFPILHILRDKLFSNGACGVEVSGSGSTIFALFNSHETLSAATAPLKTTYPEIDFFEGNQP
jgi:4-diphosphocytidyl-2-C-methyl-D-erythritol kinase